MRKALSSFFVTCAMVNQRGRAKNQHQILTNIAKTETPITMPMSGSIGTPIRVGTRVHPLNRGKACGRGTIWSIYKHVGDLRGGTNDNQTNRPSHESLLLNGVHSIPNAEAN